MPVDQRTVQPYGLLHGGASLLLAETLGSSAAVDNSQFMSAGTAISANHIRPASRGLLTGTARPVPIGRTSHLWETDIVDADGKAICVARLTTNVIPVGRLEGKPSSGI